MNRREALTRTISVAALFGFAQPQDARGATPMPESALFGTDPEAYWKRIRKEQFLLPDWRVYLNNGSLGVAPKPVVDVVCESLTRGAGLLTCENLRFVYGAWAPTRAEY